MMTGEGLTASVEIKKKTYRMLLQFLESAIPRA